MMGLMRILNLGPDESSPMVNGVQVRELRSAKDLRVI